MKGVTLNLSKSGVSLSAGPRGLKATIGNGRARVTAGIPGTGISYSKSFSRGSAGHVAQESRARSWIGAALYIVLGLFLALSTIGAAAGCIFLIFDGKPVSEALYALVPGVITGLFSWWCFKKAAPVIRRPRPIEATGLQESINPEEYLAAKKKEYESRLRSNRSDWKAKGFTDADAEWERLNSEGVYHAEVGNWGLYVNNLYDKAIFLKKEGRGRQELDLLLQVLFFDVNGPNNRACVSPELLKNFPCFDPSNFVLPTAIAKRVRVLAQELKIGSAELEVAFLKATSYSKSLKLPVSPERAWTILAKDLLPEN